MLIHLLHASLWDGILWIAIGLLQVMVVLAVHHGKLLKGYPAFSIYIHFAVIKTTLLMILPPGDHYRVYTWISFPWSTVQGFLIAASIYNIYVRSLGPKISLPVWAPREIRTTLAVILVFSALLSAIVRPQYGGPALRVFATAQEIMVPGMALALWFLVWYMRRLGIPWWPRDAQLAIGFILLLTIGAATFGVMLSYGKDVAIWMQRIGQCAGLFSFGWWSWKLWEKEPAPVRASQAELAALLESHRENMEAVAVAREVMG